MEPRQRCHLWIVAPWQDEQEEDKDYVRVDTPNDERMTSRCKPPPEFLL